MDDDVIRRANEAREAADRARESNTAAAQHLALYHWLPQHIIDAENRREGHPETLMHTRKRA